jgi:ubiquitin-conjugating enzyme E2 S
MLHLQFIFVFKNFVPAGTPYAGGVFRVKLALGKDFPQTPPKAFFLTKIFHPNVAKNGEICVNTLKKDWKPDLGIKHILLVCINSS